MSYIIYHKETTRFPALSNNRYNLGRGAQFATRAIAKGMLTRADNAGLLDHPKGEYAIADATDFHTNIEKMIERINLMSGKPYMERINTPISCSPAFETYWCM